MRAGRASPYNEAMTIDAPPEPAHFAVAGLLLDALAAHDFDRMATALDPDATLAAVLPGGHRDWRGAHEIAEAFATWFGDAEEFAVVDASVGRVGALLQLRWRLRVRATRRGPGPMVVEQHVYAAVGRGGRIDRMSLLCSGFWPEHGES
jgi:ketosteroid isomerase-like protein